MAKWTYAKPYNISCIKLIWVLPSINLLKHSNVTCNATTILQLHSTWRAFIFLHVGSTYYRHIKLQKNSFTSIVYFTPRSFWSLSNDWENHKITNHNSLITLIRKYLQPSTLVPWSSGYWHSDLVELSRSFYGSNSYD